MTRLTRRARFALGLAAATAGAAIAVSPAVAAPTPPPGLSSSTGTPTAATDVGFTWDDSIPDVLGATITYEGGLVSNAGDEPSGAVAPGVSIPVATPGQYYFRVRAVQDDGLGGITRSDYATTPVLVDRAAPTITLAFSKVPNAAGWFTAPLSIIPTCADDVALAVACAPFAWTGDGRDLTKTLTAEDVAGKTTSATTSAFNFDATAPTAPGVTAPGALAGDQPTFAWVSSTDATSKVDHYRVEYQVDENFSADGWISLATIDGRDDGTPREYSAPHSVWPDTNLPENTLLDWRVVAVDTAGNEKASSGTGSKLTIDPTVPPKPTILSGPSGPSRDTSPTFTWDGTGQSFSWTVTPIGSPSAVRSGVGEQKQATLRSLSDGTYVFHLKQYTAANRESEEASQAFTIDTTPPGAPTILSRPTFPSVTTAVFTWDVEPGAYSRWVLVGSSGTAVAGPTDSIVPRAELPSLAEGAYTFQVQQIDAAGNISGTTSEPFTVLAPLAPAPAPSGSSGTVTALQLPKQNASRLQPKAGAKVPTLVPVLKWTKGPRGTKLYNLQIFKVTQVKRAGASPKVTKIYSAFPRGRQMRAPKKKLRAGTCYVWRVWPYTGQAFTPKPVGVSNFCTASSKVIKLKAKQAAARAAKAKAAKLRAARLKKR